MLRLRKRCNVASDNVVSKNLKQLRLVIEGCLYDRVINSDHQNFNCANSTNSHDNRRELRKFTWRTRSQSSLQNVRA